jgi:hypothetical protein
MATTGLLLGWYSARWIMLSAATIFGLGAVVALLMTRWLPVTSADKDHLLEAYGEAAAGELIALNGGAVAARVAVEPPPPVPVAAGSGLERIATLLEEIERRREHEAARRPAT